MTARDKDNDLPDIRQGLADRAETLFEWLHDKPAKRGRNELRWGRKGSLVLYLRGRGGPHWHCYESGQGGDMIAAIQHVLNTDFVGALEWARDWLGMPQREARRRKQHQPEPPPARQDKPADYDAEQLEKARRAAELSAAAGPITGTLAETYLHKHRGIEAEHWPDAIGFADAAIVRRYTGWGWWRLPALVVRATDATGLVTGVQLIALQQDGSAAKHWEHASKLKLSFGMLGGKAVRLTGNDDALLLAEGPETSLSCWYVTGITTWCNLGSIARAPLNDVPLDQLIVICTDDDPRNAQSNKALRNAIRGWRREGRRVVQVKPHRLTKRDKSDFNDALRAEGREAVRERIAMALDAKPEIAELPALDEAAAKAERLINEAINKLLDEIQADRDGESDPYGMYGAEASNSLDNHASFLVLRLVTGIGKTEIAIQRIVREAARGAKIVYLVPTHKLGAELIERINAEVRRQSVVVTVEPWHGRGQEDKPDEALCSELDVIRDARVAGVRAEDVCKVCPRGGSFTESSGVDRCEYYAQFGRRAQIWVGAHDLLWHQPPKPLKGANLLVIDEGFATRGLIGFSGKSRLITETELDAVPEVDSVGLEIDLREYLMPYRETLIAALRDHPKGGLRRDRLIAAGLTAEGAKEARKLEWKAKERVNLLGNKPSKRSRLRKAARQPRGRKTWQGAKKALERAAKRNRLIGRFAALWHAVEELLVENGPPASGRAEIGNNEVGDTTVRAVRLFGAETITADWRRTPSLHIDATADMELLRCRVPHAELVGKVEAGAPHMHVVQYPDHVVQYPDKAFGKGALRNHKLLLRVWDWAVAYAAQRGGDWGIVLPKEAEIAILAAREVPSFVRLHHFGATRGIDTLKDVCGLIIVGRPVASPDVVERMAGALTGREAEPIAGDWYPAELVQLHARDGSQATVEADRHPGPLAEAIRASIAEGELLQTIGRVRGIRRTEKNPVEIALLTNVPVPGLVIDEIRQWDGPTIDEAIFGRLGVVLESAGDAAAVAELTLDQVKLPRKRLGSNPYNRLLYGNDPNLSKNGQAIFPPPNLCQVTYQLAGAGRRRQRAVFDLRRIGDPEAWLTERLGALVYFEEIMDTATLDVPEEVLRAAEATWRAMMDRLCAIADADYDEPLHALEPSHPWVGTWGIGLKRNHLAVSERVADHRQ